MNLKGAWTAYGLNNCADLLNDDGNAAYYIAVGTGTETAVSGLSAFDYSLDAELARFTATVSRETTAVSNDTVKLTYEWTVTAAYNGLAVGEVGAFDSAGRMLYRGLVCHPSTGLPTTQTLATGDVYTLTVNLVAQQGALV